MKIENKIMSFVDVMLSRCEKGIETDYIVSLRQNGSQHSEYELKIYSYRSDDVFESDMALLITFELEGGRPYIDIRYADEWENFSRIVDLNIPEIFKKRIEGLYKKSITEQFKYIFDRTKEYFDISESDIRNIEINNIINYEE